MSAPQNPQRSTPDVKVGHQMSDVTDQRGVKNQGRRHRRVILSCDEVTEITAGSRSYITLIGKGFLHQTCSNMT